MEINEYEAGMLDAVLQAFAGREELDWTKLLELFDGDEELAGAIITILAGGELIIKSGEERASGLPEKISQTPDAMTFLAEGGFSKKLAMAPAPVPTEPAPVLQEREVVFEIENKITEELPLETKIPTELVELPIAPTEPTPSSDVLLHQEIAQLRFEQRRFDHSLREKDIIIETLTAQNKTLGNFRIFIWVLLGMIAVLIVGLIFTRVK